MTMGLNLPKEILEAQTEALKPENLSAEDVGGMLRKDLPKEKLEPRADETLCRSHILLWPNLRVLHLGLKKITDDKGPVSIWFEWDDKNTMMPLSDHASHWSNYLGELIREMRLYYPSWQKVLAERKAAILTKIGTQFDLKPHMQSQHSTDINAGIQQHLQKLYNTNKASLKAAHWVINPKTGTYDVESIRQRRPENITSAD
nr:hypothetical protein [Tanacetum cinerariifolium]